MVVFCCSEPWLGRPLRAAKRTLYSADTTYKKLTQEPALTRASLRAGTMVVITLTTALIFALVVFPALCYCVNLRNTDVGSLSVLFQGRWGDFLGRRRGESSTGGARHGPYVKVGDDSPDALGQIIELTGLEAIDSEARAAAETQAPVLGPPALPGTVPSVQEAAHQVDSNKDPESLEPAGIWRGGWERRSGDHTTTELEVGEGKEGVCKGSYAGLPLVAAAEIFRIESAPLRSEGGAPSSNWGGYGGWNSSSRGTGPDSLHFREWEMSGLPSSSASAMRSNVMASTSGFVASQPEIESWRGSGLPAAAEWATKRASGGVRRISTGTGAAAVDPQGIHSEVSEPQPLPAQPWRSRGAEVGARAIGGSSEGLIEEGDSGKRLHAAAVATGINAVGGSVGRSGSVASKDSIPVPL